MPTKKSTVLILSMVGGFGHIRAGEALLDYAKEHLSAVHAEHIDISIIDPSLKKYAVLYDMASKDFPFIWKFMYERVPASLMQGAVALRGLLDRKIKPYLASRNPDAILFTNVTVVPMLLPWIKKKFPNIPVGLVVTDYHAHSYYHSDDIDRYFIANDTVFQDLMSIGVPKEKIFLTGIPINPRFYIPQSTLKLKKKYGIKTGVPVVVMIASFRAKAQESINLARELLERSKKIHLIFIANGNEELFTLAKTQLANHLRVSLVNWTYEIEEYLKIADVVVSKAGGLTVSECLTLKKPMVVVNPIPGQEERNAEFLQTHGVGVLATRLGEVANAVMNVLQEKKKKREAVLPKKNPSEAIFKALI